MLHIAILDDETECMDEIREITKKAMHQYGFEYEVKEYSDVDSFLFDLNEKDYFDIYLLDVELPKMSGIEVARRIRCEFREPSIIYITNHVEYAVEAFEVNAYRYIPKKCLQEKLFEAYGALGALHQLKNEKVYPIKGIYGMELIPIRELYYFKKEGKYVYIFHQKGQSRVRKTLAETIEGLDTEEFLVIDRSYVVNMNHIVSLKQQQIILRDGSILPISKPRLREVRQRFMLHWGNV